MSSPPAYNPLSAPPRKRQSLNLLSSNPKRRKPSTGPSLLRQASFPPPSPDGSNAQYSRSPSPADSVAVGSIVSGMTAGTSATTGTATATATAGAGGRKKYKKRKKGGVGAGAGVGDEVETDSQVTVGGSKRGGARTATGGGGGGGSVANAVGDQPDEEEVEDDEGDDVNDVVAESKPDELTTRQERENLNMLMEAFTNDQEDRYLVWRRVRLKKDTIRKIVNHTLSQSVPPSVITTVNGYTKIFIGELIEKARQVQLEWLASADTFPDGTPVPPDTPLEDRIAQRHRGPLTPDHLREALRRHKRSAAGGGAGLTGHSLMGRETAKARVGGRRIFR